MQSVPNLIKTIGYMQIPNQNDHGRCNSSSSQCKTRRSNSIYTLLETMLIDQARSTPDTNQVKLSTVTKPMVMANPSAL